MKKRFLEIALASLLALIAFPATGFAQKGESVFGVQTGYTSSNKSAIAGIFYQYRISSAVRIAPEIGCVFRHHDLDAFTCDLNVHFPLPMRSSSVDLYPLAGLNVSSWTHHHIHTDEDDDVSTRSTKLGANVGAGFQLRASENLRLKLEAKYIIISHYSAAVISVGIGYAF